MTCNELIAELVKLNERVYPADLSITDYHKVQALLSQAIVLYEQHDEE